MMIHTLISTELLQRGAYCNDGATCSARSRHLVLRSTTHSFETERAVFREAQSKKSFMYYRVVPQTATVT